MLMLLVNRGGILPTFATHSGLQKRLFENLEKEYVMLNIGKYLDEAGHIASILGYVGHMMGGKELPADAPDGDVGSIKGMASFLGLKDEQTKLSLMTRLRNVSTKSDAQAGEKAHAWIIKYEKWADEQFELLRPQIGAAVVPMRILYKNRYRNMLVGLPSSGGTKTGKVKFVSKLKRGTKTTYGDQFGKGSSDALDFLLLMGQTIQREYDATHTIVAEEWREGAAFKMIATFMKSHQMPIPPKSEDMPKIMRRGRKLTVKAIRHKRDLLEWLEGHVPEYWDEVKETAKNTDRKVAVYARYRKIKDANRPWYIRWVDKLL